MMIKYIVTEIQTDQSGQLNVQSFSFDGREMAESKFFTIMASAAVSTLPCHAVVLLTNEGQILNHGMYRHSEE